MKSKDLIQIIYDEKIKSKLMLVCQKNKDADLFAVLKSELEDQTNYDGDILGWFKDEGYYSSIESIDYSKDKKYKTETYMLRKDGFVPRKRVLKYSLQTSSVPISSLPIDAKMISQKKNWSNSRLPNPMYTSSKYVTEKAMFSSSYVRGLSAEDGFYESTDYSLTLKGQKPVYILEDDTLEDASVVDCFNRFCEILKKTDDADLKNKFEYFLEGGVDSLSLSIDKKNIICDGLSWGLISSFDKLNGLVPFYDGDFYRLKK